MNTKSLVIGGIFIISVIAVVIGVSRFGPFLASNRNDGNRQSSKNKSTTNSKTSTANINQVVSPEAQRFLTAETSLSATFTTLQAGNFTAGGSIPTCPQQTEFNTLLQRYAKDGWSLTLVELQRMSTLYRACAYGDATQRTQATESMHTKIDALISAKSTLANDSTEAAQKVLDAWNRIIDLRSRDDLQANEIIDIEGDNVRWRITFKQNLTNTGGSVGIPDPVLSNLEAQQATLRSRIQNVKSQTELLQDEISTTVANKNTFLQLIR